MMEPRDGPPAYVYRNLGWGSSPDRVRYILHRQGITDIGELSEQGTLAWVEHEKGYRIRCMAAFPAGLLTCVQVRLERETDDALTPAEMAGTVCAVCIHEYGAPEYEGPGDDALIIERRWPSDDRGSLRLTFAIDTEITDVIYQSGSAPR